MYKDLCTIMTPTFNRRVEIERLYLSLLKQKNKSFEWIVVDDGSTDETNRFFEKIQRLENGFKIKYFKIQNGGKHRAVNYGINEAEGKYFFIVDSDDEVAAGAIDRIYFWISSISDDESFAGIGGLRKYREANQNIGTSFKGEYLDCLYSQRKIFNISGDKAEVYFTEVLLANQFPVFENEKFLSEGILWNSISEIGKKIRWINEPFIICEYLDTGLTKNVYEQFKKSPKGFALFIKSFLKNEETSQLKKLYYYGLYYNLTGVSKKEMKKIFEISLYTLVISRIVYLIRKRIKYTNS